MSIVRLGGSMQESLISEIDTGDKHAASPAPLATAVRERQVWSDLADLGIGSYAIKKLETNELAAALDDSERIEAIIYGRSLDSFAVLAATEKRVLFLSKDSMSVDVEKLSLSTINGISHGKVGIYSTVTLHTYVSDYQIRTPNWPSARHFIDFINYAYLEK